MTVTCFCVYTYVLYIQSQGWAPCILLFYCLFIGWGFLGFLSPPLFLFASVLYTYTCTLYMYMYIVHVHVHVCLIYNVPVSSSSQAHLGHPQLQHLCLMFNATTARWLVLLATQESHDISTLSHDPEILFPLPKKVSLVPYIV